MATAYEILGELQSQFLEHKNQTQNALNQNQNTLNELLTLMRLQADARFNQAMPQVSVSILSPSTPSNQVTPNTSALLPTPNIPPPMYTLDPVYPMYDPYYMYPPETYYMYPPTPPSVPYAPPPPSVSYASLPLPQSTHIPQHPTMSCTTSDAHDVIDDGFHMGNHDMHDDEAIDIVDIAHGDMEDNAHDSVDESIAEVLKDDLPLSLEPMVSMLEAQDEPRETVFHVHCTDNGQVCFFVDFNDGLTNIASSALDEKLLLPTTSNDGAPE